MFWKLCWYSISAWSAKVLVEISSFQMPPQTTEHHVADFIFPASYGLSERSISVRAKSKRLQQWFSKLAERIPGDPRPEDPWIHFCNGCFEVHLFLIMGIIFC
jgi:hypothetical protein